MPKGFFDLADTWASTVNVSGTIKFTIAANDAHEDVLFVSTYDESAEPPTNFSSNLIGFNVYRGSCNGKWYMDNSSTYLSDATDCDRSELPNSQNVIRKNKTFRSLQNNLQQVLADAMVEVIDGPPPQIIQKDMSIMTSIIASLIWRKLSFDANNAAFFVNYPELRYDVVDLLQLFILTMKRQIWLYVVICIQPAIMIISMIVRACFARTPISRGFGLISFLAGINHESISLIKRASYSGSLIRPVKVRIDVVDDGEKHGLQSGHLEYASSTRSTSKSGSLKYGVNYD